MVFIIMTYCTIRLNSVCTVVTQRCFFFKEDLISILIVLLVWNVRKKNHEMYYVINTANQNLIWINALMLARNGYSLCQKQLALSPSLVKLVGARAKKKNMCVYGHPTHLIFQPPTLTFYLTLIFASDPINFYTEFG